MLSKAEARQLHALADALRASSGTPAVTEHLAGFLEAWVAEHVAQPRGLDDEQIELFAAGVRSELAEERSSLPSPQAERSSGAPLHRQEDAPSAPPTTHREVAAPPSVSLSIDPMIDRSGSKTEASSRIRPHSDEALSDAHRKVYDDVAAERGVMLPSAPFVWTKFVEHLWAVDRTFATPWNLKRAWRDWCSRERPVTQRAPEADAGDDDAPPASAQVLARRRTLLEQERERVEREAASWDTARARGDHVAGRPSIGPPPARAAPARALPEPRSQSA